MKEVVIRSLEIVVGTKEEEYGIGWSLRIRKYEDDSEPRVSFEGNPTMAEFKRAFEVLSTVEIGTQLKELVEKIQRQIAPAKHKEDYEQEVDEALRS